ncbi:uncharacterized protein LOC135961332 [Calliphora vicina]|uniref:uncharacterized protein LOC135961332 n=1 Tax=Calliphora vicina TaxID=7373 RepID=UPI00325BE242
MTKGYQHKAKKSTSFKQQHSERNIADNLQKQIEAQELSLDSPSSSTTTASSELSIYPDEEEEIAINILDTLYDTTGESSDEEGTGEEQEHLQTKSLVEEVNFFTHLGEIPDIVNISEDISVCTIIPEKEAASKDATKDTGYFVDPLTGSELQARLGSSSLIGYNEDESKETLVASDEHSVSESQQSELSDILLPEDILFEETGTTTYDKQDNEATDLFETFLELDLSKVDDAVDDIDWEALAKQQEAERLHQHTLEFINDIIHRVVEIAEFISPEQLQRQKLDKRKLFLEISHVYHQYEVELKVSELLNRKVVEFFKRKKLYRPIMQDNVKTLPLEKLKYKKAMQHLDELLAKENAMNDSCSGLAKRLHNELEVTEQKVHNDVLMFEDLVKKNLFRESCPQSNALIEQLLRRMAKYRKEVSEVRYRMISKQHTHAILIGKLATLEDLGNGLTLKNYDHIQTENQNLDKKIEERNVDLKKLYLRSRNCLHLLAHFKEKRTMINDIIATQRSALSDLYEERSSLRKYIYQLKLKRSRIRQQINELSIQGGLLDKPALMYDYDQTVERLDKHREIVNRLRVTLQTIQQRIIKLEKRLTRDNHNFSMI